MSFGRPEINLGHTALTGEHTLSSSAMARQNLSSFAFGDMAGRSMQHLAAAEVAPVGDATSDIITTPTGAKRLDPTKSPKDLIRAGVLTDKTQSTDGTLEVQNFADFSAPKVSVEMQDLTKQPPDKANFVIKKNGEIELHSDPETLNTKDIKVQLERTEGQLEPTPEQQKAADELVAYLSQRLKAQNSELAANGVEVSDKDNVISSETKQSEQMRVPADQSNMTPETQQSVGNMNRFNGSGNNGGEMPMGNTQEYFPPRDVPRQLNESDKQAAIKEAVAGLFNADKAAPYETVRQTPQGDYRVGRYGFSGNQIMNWLEGLDLGDPPDPAKIAELIKQGKLPKGFNADSVKKLKAMAGKMAKGEQPSKEDMQLLPKEMQETMATDMVEQYKGALGDKPGDIAAAMLSGKPASEIKSEDLTAPEGKQLSEAGQRLYDVATAKQQSEDDNDVLQWDKTGKVSIGEGKWLAGDAGRAFLRAQEQARANGINIEINSAGRTYEDQARLYASRGRNGVSAVVAEPGTSNHERGNALDVQNWQQAKPYLLANGFIHGDGRGPIEGDLVHFKYVGN